MAWKPMHRDAAAVVVVIFSPQTRSVPDAACPELELRVLQEGPSLLLDDRIFCQNNIIGRSSYDIDVTRRF